MQSFWQRVERVFCKLTPAALTMFLVFFAAVPMRVPGIAQFMPAFTLINIYYWGIFLPGALPYSFLFILGLLQDTFVGAPLGLSSFVNVLLAFFLTIERGNFGKIMFRSVWFGFAVLSGVILLLQWSILSFYFAKMLPVMGCFLQWVVTCLFYPLLHVLFTYVYRVIQQ